MSISVGFGNMLAPCCFCQTETRLVTMEAGRELERQVACCFACAAKVRHVQVPSWQAWMDLRMTRALPVAMRLNHEAVRKLFRPGGVQP